MLSNSPFSKFLMEVTDSSREEGSWNRWERSEVLHRAYPLPLEKGLWKASQISSGVGGTWAFSKQIIFECRNTTRSSISYGCHSSGPFAGSSSYHLPKNGFVWNYGPKSPVAQIRYIYTIHPFQTHHQLSYCWWQYISDWIPINPTNPRYIHRLLLLNRFSHGCQGGP